MTLRLHSRLVALNVVAMGIVLLLLGYFLATSLRARFETEIEDQLFKSANLARTYIRMHTGSQDPVGLAVAISDSLQVGVTIIAADGRVLGDSGLTREAIAAVENHNDLPEVIQAREIGRGTSIRRSSPLAAPFIYVATIADDGSVIRLAMPFAAVETLIGGLRRQLLLAFLFAIAMALAFGYMVYAVVSRPLRRMADASHQLAAGNLNYQIPEAGDRDLGSMASSLNAMARSLKGKIEELQDDKKRTETIIATMSAGVVVFDREARVVLANQSIRQLLDIHGDPTGRLPMELVRHPSIDMAVHDALRGSVVPAIDVMTSTGRVLLAKGAPVRTSSGDVELVVMTFHDLTEVRRIERMRKDFIGNVSHEFKTPLTSIRGYAETLLNSLSNSKESDPGLTREFLEAIERNSLLLQALVDDLLVLARLEAELPVERQPVKIRELVEEHVQARMPQLQERNISVEVECIATEIMADGSRLARAISNLLDNAIHYNRAGGTVRITGRMVSGAFALDIADSGTGIPQKDLARIFERFYRVDKSRSREAGGTGLGLAIARHAVESQGGSISVSSKVGTGSTFTIFLPAAISA